MSAEGDSARPGPDVSGTSSHADPAVPQERVAVTAAVNQFNSALEPNGMAVMPFQVRGRRVPGVGRAEEAAGGRSKPCKPR